MASSGTVALSVDFRYKPSRGREESLVAGYSRVKSTAVIEANDLELRTIKAFNITQYASRDQSGGPDNLYGSVNTSGSLMNAVTITSLRGTIERQASGTQHLGTVAAGTHQLSFTAIGA